MWILSLKGIFLLFYFLKFGFEVKFILDIKGSLNVNKFILGFILYKFWFKIYVMCLCDWINY